MKAIIFNSGVNLRFDSKAEKIKCLEELPNCDTILGHQIRNLSKFGIKDFIITTNPYNQTKIQEETKRFPECTFEFINNYFPDKTNNSESFRDIIRSRKLGSDDIIVLHGDLVMSERTFGHIIRNILQGYKCFGTKRHSFPKDYKDFKAGISYSDIVLNVSTSLDDLAEDVYFGDLAPIYYLEHKDWIYIYCKLMEMSVTSYFEDAFDGNLNLDFCNLRDSYPWKEVDTSEDLIYIKENFNDFI